ncbi:MAG: hypothetical protein ACOCXH_02850 [Cyclobacteriaceae bacterium]
MARLYFTLIIILLIAKAGLVSAQIRINRSWQVSPFQDSIGDTKRFFGNFLFAAEANHGWFSEEDALTWTIRYHGFMELYRWGDRSLLGLYLGHELHANPFNDIYFNPRAAFWNESLLFYHQLASFYLKAGIEHRCRHDIDNLDPPSPAMANDYQGLGRIIVLNSVLAGASTKSFSISKDVSLTASGTFYYYLYAEDSREPQENQQGTWENIIASTSLAYQLKYSVSKILSVYQRSNLDYLFIREVDLPVNTRLELGISLQGQKGRLNIFTGYEYFFDDVTSPIPRQSAMIFAGIRGGSLAFF